jgi:hypothetical protein
MQCILYKIYFWKVFIYTIIWYAFFLYALLFAQNFILAKSGCYTQESEVLVCSAQFEHEATKMAGTNRGLWARDSLSSLKGKYHGRRIEPQAQMQPSHGPISCIVLWPGRAKPSCRPTWHVDSYSLISTIKEEVITTKRMDVGMGHIRRRLRLGEVKCFHEDTDGVLCFNNCLVDPKEFELYRKIMNEAHCLRYSIHPGTNKMYQDLKKNFWWTRMKWELARYVAKCDTCHRVKADHLRTTGNLQPLSVPEWK